MALVCKWEGRESRVRGNKAFVFSMIESGREVSWNGPDCSDRS